LAIGETWDEQGAPAQAGAQGRNVPDYPGFLLSQEHDPIELLPAKNLNVDPPWGRFRLRRLGVVSALPKQTLENT
jgi:hypothetical protein